MICNNIFLIFIIVLGERVELLKIDISRYKYFTLTVSSESTLQYTHDVCQTIPLFLILCSNPTKFSLFHLKYIFFLLRVTLKFPPLKKNRYLLLNLFILFFQLYSNLNKMVLIFIKPWFLLQDRYSALKELDELFKSANIQSKIFIKKHLFICKREVIYNT